MTLWINKQTFVLLVFYFQTWVLMNQNGQAAGVMNILVPCLDCPMLHKHEGCRDEESEGAI